jgi:HK97 family phage major capsid protein
LIAPGTTTGNAIGYMRATPTANPATVVAEGAAKPEATLSFAAVTDPLRKIATWLPVSDEFLEDVPGLRSYIDAQLRVWVREVADDELLNGSGVAPHLTGILTVPGIGTLAQGTNTALDALALAIAQVQTASGFAADGIVVNATDWGQLGLVKDANGNYLGGSPFGPPAPATLWGRRVVPTTKIAAGTALVGAFRVASQLFTKGGIQLAASNSHQDFFVKNLTAIRAEIRAALALYRPSAFCKVTGLTPVAPPA